MSRGEEEWRPWVETVLVYGQGQKLTSKSGLRMRSGHWGKEGDLTALRGSLGAAPSCAPLAVVKTAPPPGCQGMGSPRG